MFGKIWRCKRTQLAHDRTVAVALTLSTFEMSSLMAPSMNSNAARPCAVTPVRKLVHPAKTTPLRRRPDHAAHECFGRINDLICAEKEDAKFRSAFFVVMGRVALRKVEWSGASERAQNSSYRTSCMN